MIKIRKNTKKSKKELPKGAAARLKHVQNAYFCVFIVFLGVFEHLAGTASAGKGGRGIG